MLEPKREEVECQNVRQHVASDCYILPREEVGPNKSDNEGLREANSAFQIFSCLDFFCIPPEMGNSLPRETVWALAPVKMFDATWFFKY